MILKQERPLEIGTGEQISQRASNCDFCFLLASLIKDSVRTGVGLSNSSRFRLWSEEFGEGEGDAGRQTVTRIELRWTTAESRFFDQAVLHTLQISPSEAEGGRRWPFRSDRHDQASKIPRAREVSNKCEFATFRSWLVQCETNHGFACRWHQAELCAGLRLIDVESQSIMSANKGRFRYVALSYVWGIQQARTECLRLDNMASADKPGFLNTLKLPVTISAAMEVVKGMGERYLWCEALCIIQDDPKDVQRYIPDMARIYQNAVLTIVAAYGENADSGLPGVGHCKRTIKKLSCQIHGFELTSTFDGSPDLSKHPLSASKWCKRAWTMQERLLSRRCLIFTRNQVYWECSRATWLEETQLEMFDGFKLAYAGPHIARTRPSTTQIDMSPGFWQDEQNLEGSAYRILVREYTLRSLTYDEDILNAFEVVLDVIGQMMATTFLWALPRRTFDRMLMWNSETSDNWSRRRVCSKFPSWSWLSWQGSIQITLPVHAWARPVVSASKVVKYFMLSTNGNGTATPVPVMEPSQDDAAEYREVTASDIANHVLLEYQDRIESQFHLLFWAGVSNICLRYNGDRSAADTKKAVDTKRAATVYRLSDKFCASEQTFVLDPKFIRQTIGYAEQMSSDWNTMSQGGPTAVYSAVAIGSCYEGGVWQTKVILLAGSGAFSQRVGIASIQKELWVMTDPKEELVVLG